MDPWVLWLIAAVILAIGEIVTTELFLAPFAAGAAVAALLAAAGAGATIEWAAFLVVSVVAARRAAPDRPRASAQPRRRSRRAPRRWSARRATVVERIANAEGVGCVKLDGEIWTARAYDDDEVIEPGTRVHVLEIRGATALVSE